MRLPKVDGRGPAMWRNRRRRRVDGWLINGTYTRRALIKAVCVTTECSSITDRPHKSPVTMLSSQHRRLSHPYQQNASCTHARIEISLGRENPHNMYSYKSNTKHGAPAVTDKVQEGEMMEINLEICAVQGISFLESHARRTELTGQPVRAQLQVFKRAEVTDRRRDGT